MLVSGETDQSALTKKLAKHYLLFFEDKNKHKNG